MQIDPAGGSETFIAPSRCGEVIGTGYVLGEVLGVGGMGVVYTATQRSLDRTVAIKLPHRELFDDPLVRDRFRAEALAGSRVNHPNVVRVLDFGEHQGAPYLVMEHVVGPRLGQLLRERGPMPSAMVVGLVRQIVSGLEDVHAAAIVHADVKSDNILVETTRDGLLVPRLIDFGIARFGGSPAIHAPTTISGTAEYLAPEVICGCPPSFASDVYAIGVILYELLTGATPFAGGDPAKIMSRRLEDDAVPMTWRYPDREIPADLDALVVRALARDPTLRYPDAAALGLVLDVVALMCGVPTHAYDGPPTEPIALTAETITAKLGAEAVLADGSLVARRRVAVMTARIASDMDAMALAYLDLARALIDEHQLRTAVTELEEGLALLTLGAGSGRVWPLLLTLAALHDGLGDRARARSVAAAARGQAVREGSSVGCERAEMLFARLSGRRSSP